MRSLTDVYKRQACIGPAVDDEHPFPDHGLAVGLEYFEKFRRAAVPDERGARLDLHISLFQAVVGYLVQQPRVGHMEQYLSLIHI